MDIIRLKHILKLSVGVILLLAGYFFVTGYKEHVPAYMEVMRWVLMGIYIITINLSINKSISKSLFLSTVFVLFWILSVCIQTCYLNDTHLIFAGVDAWQYIGYAVRYNSLGILDYWVELLRSGRFNIDDLGYGTLAYLAAKPFGDNVLATAHVLMLINSVAYVIGVTYFYKLCKLLFSEEWRVNAATGLWSGFSFLIVTNAVGLKEGAFTAIIIIGMYNIYRYKQTPSILRLIYAIISIALTYFFRYAICFMLVVALIIMVITTEQNKKAVLRLALLVILFSIPILTVLLPLIMNKSLDAVMATADARVGATGASSIQSFLFPILALFFGPFPNMDRTNQYGFMYGFALLFKDLLSPFFLSAVYLVVRRYVQTYFPVLAFVFCNMLMLIVSGVSADMRYHITYMPFFFMMLFVPGNRSFKGWVYWVYVIAVMLIILMYSTREVSDVAELGDMQYMLWQ